jgi:putative ABC transport system permease protein
MSFFRDLRLAFHSLMHSKSLAAIVILTLALGIGANAAIFTLVRGVLLKPLVNRDENRLVYIRQSAPSGGQDNTTFSVPEIKDIETNLAWFTAASSAATTLMSWVCVLFSAVSSDLKTVAPTPLASSY